MLNIVNRIVNKRTLNQTLLNIASYQRGIVVVDGVFCPVAMVTAVESQTYEAVSDKRGQVRFHLILVAPCAMRNDNARIRFLVR